MNNQSKQAPGTSILTPCQSVSLKKHFFLCALMALPVMEFQDRDTKFEIFLHKNQHTQRKLIIEF